ncbi:hypothetical protein DFH06DRAFT_1474636 [Mycena polygramma]|nr:hypothetical protein DFH06DRAFT_1474636 [Mycena polygramma]
MCASVCFTCGCGFVPSAIPTDAQTQELQQLLRSNAVPPDVSLLQNTIAAASSELERYGAEIQRVYNTFRSLLSSRSTLAAYESGCRSLCAPIRRLPPELLVEIFDICSVDVDKSVWEDSTTADEFDRVSKRKLLQLSQVCAHWRKLAIGTPQLWSTILCDTSLWRPSSSDTLLSLLDSSLSRGGDYPLKIQVAVLSGDPYQEAVLALLSRHAPRWLNVYVSTDLASSRYLSSVKGNLHRLEKFHMVANWNGVDILRGAPCLSDFTVVGAVADIPELPWAQIRTFAYFGPTDVDLAALFLLLRDKQSIVDFTLDLDLSGVPVDISWPSLSSDIQTLHLQLGVSHLPAHASQVVGLVFKSLTLPCLRALNIMPMSDPGPPPVWHSEHFLELADRSSFHSHLTRLHIDAVITEQELLRCVAVLSLLEELCLCDCRDSEHDLITDALLQGLSRNAENTTLLPSLAVLCLTSRLRFTDAMFLDFVSSRLPSTFGECFQAEVWWLPDRHREFPPELVEQLSILHCEGTFRFVIEPDI